MLRAVFEILKTYKPPRKSKKVSLERAKVCFKKIRPGETTPARYRRLNQSSVSRSKDRDQKTVV